MDAIQILTDPAGYIITHHPRAIVYIVTYILFSKVITHVRDVFDKTPLTDDTPFERFATLTKKLTALLFLGVRPKAPESTKPEPGAAADATGVKVEEKKP